MATAAASMGAGIALSPDLVRSLTVGKVFKQQKGAISCLDFDDSGESMVTCSEEDETIYLYDCRSGLETKKLYSRKYGIQLAKFTHAANCILHTSTKEDFTIRYLSLHDNKYMRYFRGHQALVNSLDMSPVDDSFISSSADGTVRLWDVRSDHQQGQCNTTGPALAAFEPWGRFFAIGMSDQSIRLYDMRSYDKVNSHVDIYDAVYHFSKGPFNTITRSPTVDFRPDDQWTSLKFSNDGKLMLITTRSDRIYVLDTEQNSLRYVLNDIENRSNLKLEASFSPDGEFIFSGSGDGHIHVWETASGSHIGKLPGHTGPAQVVKFNPRFLMMASGCANVAFWIPSVRLNFEQ